MPERHRPDTAGTLDDPAKILGPLEECLTRSLRAGASGWSSTADLARDLERLFGLEVSARAIGRAVREIGRSRRIQVVVDDAGTVWYRVRLD